jgi:hypothetical protein
MSTRHIVQIIPANGWNAVYAIRPDRNNNDPVWISQLACWALVQEEQTRYVVGIDSTLSFCDQGDNFLGYSASEMRCDTWKEQAIDYLRNPNRKKKWRQAI